MIFLLSIYRGRTPCGLGGGGPGTARLGTLKGIKGGIVPEEMEFDFFERR